MNQPFLLGSSVSLSPDACQVPDSEARPVMDRLKALTPGSPERGGMSLPTLQPGEQYRFHFDMTRCIGCRCCEVACNEQNNNPAHVKWRRVGEVEGGDYPYVFKLHVSMACNHCLEPACLEGCPTGAYDKLDNGIVTHDAKACIGCQYCTWNCPYGVPQFHPERRIVTKCHMCTERVAAGQNPACVEACPTQAIQIEAVDKAGWRDAIHQAEAPGVPPADITLSTTRITLPEELPDSIGERVAVKLQSQPAHWSLVLFLTLSQASVGMAAAAAALFAVASSEVGWAWLALGAFAVHQVALGTTLFHLGRPAFAFRAVKAWRRSWLSREVIVFGLYAGAAAAPAGLGALWLWRDELALPPAVTLAALVAALASGLAGVLCSARIYQVPARPAWDSWRTSGQFFGTALLLGACGALLAAAGGNAGTGAWMVAVVTAAAAILQAAWPWTLALEGGGGDAAARGAATLLTHHHRRLLVGRTLALGAVAAAAPIAITLSAAGLALLVTLVAFGAEVAGRYLFFVAVVPRNMPGSFFQTQAAH